MSNTLYNFNMINLRPRSDSIYISRNFTSFAAKTDGFIKGGAEHGLFVYQTRLLSKYQFLINEKPVELVSISNIEQHKSIGYYIFLSPTADNNYLNGDLGPGGEVSTETVEILSTRTVGDGMHEDIDITNFTRQFTAFNFKIELASDFADYYELKGERQQTGKITKTIITENSNEAELKLDYKAENYYNHQGNTGYAVLNRSLIIYINNADSKPIIENDSISFQVKIAPQGKWHCCINFFAEDEGERLVLNYECTASPGIIDKYAESKNSFLENVPDFKSNKVISHTYLVLETLKQAKNDLIALRFFNNKTENLWTLAAGLPVYLSLFGRDTLTASWQALMLTSDIARGSLTELANYQTDKFNAWRDEEPGRMLHHAEVSPLSILNYNPKRFYYGAVTTPAFYPVVVSELWHWTGNKDIIKQFIEPALKGLEWCDRYSDLDKDGFYEYQTKSEQGVRNQAWKDAHDSIVYENGDLVETPIAACEQQGYVYIAKLHMAEVLWWFDEKDLAKKLYNEAQELKKRFNEKFWIDEEKFFAMGLDPQKRKIKSIGSNAGHSLATGIINEEFVKPTIDRLMSNDMFSGWGIRTLSSQHPAYNPYSYHRGSVWPVENGTFAIALLRYGLFDKMHTLSKAQFEIASLCEAFRLPELIAGHQRDDLHPFPAMYPRANSPQAWSASSVFCYLQAMLGLYPYAPLKTLLVDPHLPEWLPDITVENLCVGESKVTIKFYRISDEKSDYEVIDKNGTLHILRQPSPWSLTASLPERLTDAIISLLPGK